MGEQEKIYIGLGLVILALFEFFTAMYLFGNKPKSGAPKKHLKLALRLHRIFGYVFLIVMVWLMWLGAVILRRLSESGTGYQFHGPRFFHAFLAVVLLLVLLLKISFVRMYKNYRLQARLLGFILSVGTVATWLIAGWFYLIMMGSWVVER